ncbi:acyltransferase, partial [Desulfobacterales bacterium HSG17]|nr:acyltransferase [Desulfobacterales bacterium HSG17]
YIKLQVESPLRLVIFLFCFFMFLTVMSLKRRQKDGILSISQADQMKGIAILMILIGHLFGHALEYDPGLNHLRHLGTVGVTLFLMLSGYGLSQSLKKKGVQEFFFQRATRIYVPVFLVMVPEVLLTHILSHSDSSLVQDLARIVVNLPAVDRNMWFIQFIFFWYCLVFITFQMKLNDNSKVAVLFLAALVMLAIPRLSPSMKINAFSFPLGCWMGFHTAQLTARIQRFVEKNLPYALLMATAGIFLSQIMLELSDRLMEPGFWGVGLLGLLCGIGILGFGLFRKINIHFSRELVSLLFILAVITPYLIWVFHEPLAGRENMAGWVFGNLACLFLALVVIFIPSIGLRFGLYARFLAYSGSISYEMFLVHGMFMYSFDFILFRGPLTVTFPLYFVLMCLLCSGIQRLGNRLIAALAPR